MEKGVLLLAFGGPTRGEEVAPFLKNVTAGHSIPQARIDLVLEQYRMIGGTSPLNELTFQQSKSLEELLQKKNVPVKVYVGMRHWPPLIQETLLKMKEDGIKKAVGIVLAPHRSQASWEKYLEKVLQVQKEMGPETPQIEFCAPWHEHPLWIEAISSRIEESIRANPEIKENLWLFTAHSIPLEMDAKSNYSQQIKRTAELVAEKLQKKNWEVVYQSRSGRPQDPWLEPDINDKLTELDTSGIKSVTVIPIGFICDHVEVLYDLDVKAKETARKLNISFHRVKTVNAHPKFIEMLSEIVIQHAS